MPLQAFNTDANGTRFHNMFSPNILANKQCYLNSQIQTARTTVLNNFGNRFQPCLTFSDRSGVMFLPQYFYEELTPPSTGYRIVIPTYTNDSIVIKNPAYAPTANASNPVVSLYNTYFESISSTQSTFVVSNNKAIASITFTNNGDTLTLDSNFQFFMAGVVENPLFVADLANTRYCNHFGIAIKASVFSGGRLQNMTSTNRINFRTLANNTNYTFQCAMNSGDGTTVSGLWATHLALVDSTAAPGDYCIGTVPPIVLLGRGAYTLGSIYKFNNVGEGTTNANAYDRWYIAGPTYGTSGDRILMQVYYEP